MSAGPLDRRLRRFFVFHRRAALLRLSFILIAFLWISLLTLRPIPGVHALNDTGRYVASQMDSCSTSISEIDTSNLAWRSFDLIMRPACVFAEPHLFMFATSLALPLGLLLFADWSRQGTLIISSALMVSMAGFELMTNALRQGVALPFLLAGFYFDKKLPKFIFLGIAMLLHDSNWFFAPLAILIAFQSGLISKKALAAWFLPVLAGVVYLFYVRFFSVFGTTVAMFDFYSMSYSDRPNLSFLIFVLLPIGWIFFTHALLDRAGVSREEQTTFAYLAVVLVGSALLIQDITYRFTMTGIVLQAFTATRSRRFSLRTAIVISAGLIVHFLIYALVSKNVMGVING